MHLVQRVYGDFGLDVRAAKLSTRPAEFLGDDRHLGSTPRAQLKAALDASGRAYTINEGTARSTGRRSTSTSPTRWAAKWQCATIQLDYQLPERFDLNYVGADNAEHRPVVIHRAIFGSFERFIAILIEHYAGRVPAVAGAGAGRRSCRSPTGTRPYAASVRDRLAAAGLRVELDGRQEKIGYKIREAQLQKIPYMLVAGDREAAEGTVSVRSRSGGDLGARTVDEFVRQALAEVAAKGEPEAGLAAAS